MLVESLEARVVLSAAFDITDLTALRNDPAYSGVTGQGVGIAVLDTGVYAQNPDLSANVVAFYNAVKDPITTSNLAVSGALDTEGHGSHVTGIAASSNASIGVAYQAKVVDIRVFADSGESQLGGDPVLRGLKWVANNYQLYNIKVVNLSLGEGGVNDNTVTAADARNAEAVQIAALEALGITVVTASGNSYANDPVPGASFPAVVSTISVANTWATSGQAADFGSAYGGSGDRYYAIEYSASPDTLASTSQRSTLPNQLAAPGEDIYSTWNGTHDSSNNSDLLHNTISGTSMATPFVSGVVALMQQAAKLYGGHYLSDPNQILQILQQTADTVVDSNNPNNARYDSSNGSTGNLPETGLSFKRVNVLAAIKEVQRLVTGGSVTIGPAPGPDTDNKTATALPVNNIDGTSIVTFDGNIGNDGLVIVGGADVDLYKLDVVSPGSFTITLARPSTGTAFAGALTLFNSAGTIIKQMTGTAGSYPTLTTAAGSPLAIGTYYLGVSAVGNEAYTIQGGGVVAGATQGDYTLQIQLTNPDPNGTAQGASTIDLTQANEILSDGTGRQFTDVIDGGVLGSDPPPNGSNNRITVASDVDMSKLVAPDTGSLTISTDTSSYFFGADTYLKVYDANLTLLKSNDDISGFNSDSTVTINVVAGQTYYVAVTVPANSGFDPNNPYNSRGANATPSDRDYDLHFAFDNGDSNGTAVTAVEANIGTTNNGVIGSDNNVALLGADGGNKDVDFLTYTASSAGVFDVTAHATTSGFTPILSLWEFTAGQQDIVKVADTSSLATPHLIVPVTAGQTFFVAITGLGNNDFNWFAVASGSGGQTGSYSLTTAISPTASLQSLSDNSIVNNTPELIAEGQTIKGNLSMDDSLVVGPTDVDLYRFVPAATESIDVRTLTNQEGDADTVLRFFDSSGNQLAANDNASPNSTASGMTVSVQAGQTYYIGVSGAGANALAYKPLTGASAGSGSTGDYSISVAVAAPGFSVNSPAAVAAYDGSEIIFTVTLSQALSADSTVNFATADGTALAGTDYTSISGTLTFPAGTTSQTVSVTVINNPVPGTRTFTLELSAASGAQISSSAGTGTINDVEVTTVSFSAGVPKAFTNTAGKRVSLILNGAGTGTAVFIGGSRDPSQITLDGTTAASTFSITGGATTISQIVVTGSLAYINGKFATLSGNLNVTGSLAKLTLADVSGGTSGGSIFIGADGGPMLLALGRVSNESFSTPGAIASLSVTDWINSGGGAVNIAAASIASIKTKGDFGASLTAQSLGNVKIAGSVTGGVWTVAGGGGTISVTGDAAAGWVATFGGALGTVRMNNDSGSLTAASIRSVTLNSNLTDATIRTTGASGTVLGALKIGNLASGSHILSSASIGKVSVGGFVDSTLFAGVSDTVTSLPSAAADFTSDASILSFSVSGKVSPFSFSNSQIAASSIGKVSLARVNTDNAGVAFGTAAKSIGAYTVKGGIKWTSKQPVDLLVPDGDLVVRLL